MDEVTQVNSYCVSNLDNSNAGNHELLERIEILEKENRKLKKTVRTLKKKIKKSGKSKDCETFNHNRQFRVTGPLRLPTLPFVADFLDYNLTHKYPLYALDGRHSCSADQVPHIAKLYMKWLGDCYERKWSFDLVEALVSAADKRNDFSPGDYPHCVTDFYLAFDKFPINGKDVLIAGSISPWNEAIAIAYNASSVTTSDYSDLLSLHPKITVVSATQILQQNKASFDVICSFSSIEHDGLGRYGDPIDPTGDFSAMREFRFLLKPGGLLYLGIPIGSEGSLHGNFQRIYNYNRLSNLITQTGFELVDTIEQHWGHYSEAYWMDKWENQPIFILKST